MKFRALNRMIAFIGGYFWLPCPCCGQNFGGHEWGYTNDYPDSIDGKGICADCAKAGKGNFPPFFSSNDGGVIWKNVGKSDE